MSAPRWNLQHLLTSMVSSESSDLHLVAGYPPIYRTHGTLHTVGKGPTSGVLAGDDIGALLTATLAEPHRSRVLTEKNVDCSLALEGQGTPCRFRVNVFRAQGSMGACFRYIPRDVPSFEWMSFPLPLAQRIIDLPNGLVFITGITGSGKTTTLAALMQLMIRTGQYRIITIEEPIEYVFEKSGTAVVSQREVGVDVDSFHQGLVSGLRQDPDVILVGEIRDRDTAEVALAAAETGHLILTTLHTQDAKGAVTRFVDLFPRDTQDDVRAQLSLSLRYVVCQHLLSGPIEGQRRALALEVLPVTQPVRAAIRFGKVESIESILQTGRRDGMVALDESLAQLATAGRLTWDTARRFAKDPTSLERYLSA